MDLKVSLKETRLQPEGLVDVYIPDVFEIYPEYDVDGVTILGAPVYDSSEEQQQSSLFASIKQRGSDPINPEQGVQWAECLIGEVDPALLVTQIKQAVRDVSANCDVVFSTRRGTDGVSYLAYEIKVVPA